MNDTDLNTTDAETWLTQNGWKEYPNQFKKYARCFYKRFPNSTPCSWNDDKPGIQVELAVYERDGMYGFGLEIVAGLKDATGLRIEKYALPNKLEDVLSLVPGLIDLWEYATNQQQEPGLGI